MSWTSCMQRRVTHARGQAQRPARGQGRAQRLAGGALLALTLWLLVSLTSATTLLAAAIADSSQASSTAPRTPYLSERLPPTASCRELAHADPTATNGTLWGEGILPGLGASGGWFGVPVCANGVNEIAPGGANVSCDVAPASNPANVPATGPTVGAVEGCAPGEATTDDYGLSFQCVELVARFAAWAYGDAPGAWRGNAPYLWLPGDHPAEFTAERDGVSLQAPQPGDILVWGSLDSQGRPWPAGPAGGHVAVVAAVGGGQITFVEENMLGHRGAEAINIPSETTTLSLSATGGWTLGPTYGLNGGRALYGWLRSARDTGHFPTDAATGSGPSGSTPSTTVPSTATTASSSGAAVTLPSLAQGVVVTPAGALAALVWSDTRTPERPSGPAALAPSSQPEPALEPLGTPPGMTLAPDQTSAVVRLPTGERYVFVRGEDGALYSVYTSPHQTSVAWQALGAPPGVTLVGEVSALWSRQDGIQVGALGSDGGYWLCSGPAGMLGAWLSLGHPAETTGFQGSPILTLSTASSGQSASAATDDPGRRALAIGMDGRLYEADWSAQAAANPASAFGTESSGTPPPAATTNPSTDMPPGWSAWTPVMLSGVTSALSPSVIVATTAPVPHASASAATGQASQGGATGELALVLTDTSGQVWLLQRGAEGQAWQVTLLRLPTASVVVAAAVPAPTTLAVYTADAVATVVAPTTSAQPGSTPGATPSATPVGNVTPTPTVPAHAASATISQPRISQATRPASAPAQRPSQAQVNLGIFTLSAGVGGATAANTPSVGNWTALGDVTLVPAAAGSGATVSSSANSAATVATATMMAGTP
ncbi:MAG: CHAP domain-containing protein, partial [Ktedonobacterales bacterium]